MLFRSGEVHNARVRLHSTETLVIISYKPSEYSRAIVLYSMREKRCYKLPPFPYLGGRIPHTSQCVPLDGKIYFGGGEFLKSGPGRLPGSDGVYVLDLCGAWQWKRCERMMEPRVQYGRGILDGKIYVFGGLSNRSALCGSEVYDPKEDTWSPIKATTCLRYDHEVASVGAELLVHGGKVVEQTQSVWSPWAVYHAWSLPGRASNNDVVRGLEISAIYMGAKKANSLEVYNAVKDEWSVVESVGRQETDISFMAKGKLHVMNSDEIHVHDTQKNLWTPLHSHSLSARGLVDSQLIVLRAAVAVDDRLLTIAEGVDQYGEIKLSKAAQTLEAPTKRLNGREHNLQFISKTRISSSQIIL